MRSKKFLVAIAGAASFSLCAWADTLILKDGNTYSGTFISGDSRAITFDTGRTQRFRIDEVQSVQFGSNSGRYGSANREMDRGSIFPETGNVSRAIEDKYRQVGSRRGELGAPIGDVQVTADGSGRFQDFRNGSIYWSPQTGAHVMVGGIRDKWLSMGGPTSDLGYPASVLSNK